MADVVALARKAAQEAGIPPDLYLALITRGERSYKGWQTSPAGANGPAQLMPGTAAALAQRYGIDPRDYYGNLLGGAYYLKEQLDRFGDPRLAVAAYNAGPGAVLEHGGVPPYRETQRYVSNVLRAARGQRRVPAPPASSPAAALSGPLLTPTPDMSGQIFANLGEIAAGRMSPLESLTSLTSALGMHSLEQPESALVDLRGHPVAQASKLKALGAGGGWAGTEKPTLELANLGLGLGLHISSEKRDRKLTSTGNPSDHWVGTKNAFATDLSGDVDRMDEAAVKISQRLGIPYKKGRPLVATVTRGGLRYQLLYRTHVGGDHFTHIHVGVRRVG